nr:D-2-hydroxyglutarate dehydrogenase, mitochondrial-like isoform X2 [Dermacentor andersoni]
MAMMLRRCGQLGRRHASSSRVHEHRGPYAMLNDADVATFERLLGPSAVLTDPADTEAFNVDWLRTCHGSGAAVLLPSSTEEVSAVLSHCHGRRLAICPQGGNTGLVGGSVPVFDELVLSTARMAKVNTIDPLSGAVSCEAGCVLEALDTQVGEEAMLAVPLDLGAKGSCQIGGNVATNAGGLRLLRYGPLHGSVLGLEAVLADGTVLDTMQTLRKDNTGLDLKQLFIGSEGILGIITRIAIQCVPRPSSVCVAFLGCPSFKATLQTFHMARRQLPEFLSSFEVMDAESMRCVRDNLRLRMPLEGEHPFYLLIEVAGSNDNTVEESLLQFVDSCMGHSHVSDGTMAKDSARVKELWRLRESIGEALRHDGYVYKYDISVPLASYMDAVALVREKVRDTSAIRVCGFGHMGDSNLHLNVTAAGWDEALLTRIEPFVYEWTASVRGSISAEHGIGLHKKRHLHLCKTPAALGAMHSLKRTFDPLGILNPYKMLPTL